MIGLQLLEERIKKDGRVLPGDILKVDSFLNHRIDVPFICELGREFHRLYGDAGVTAILTIEASGIGIACLTAQYFGVPVVFAKKSKSKNITGELYSSSVESYTHGTTYEVTVSKKFLGRNDRVLIIDDFLANGKALEGLIDICRQAGAEVVGAGIAVEKAYQHGGDIIRSMGVRVESLARISGMSEKEGVRFLD